MRKTLMERLQRAASRASIADLEQTVRQLEMAVEECPCEQEPPQLRLIVGGRGALAAGPLRSTG